jgi:membrane-bound lytic murein transglycosylase A
VHPGKNESGYGKYLTKFTSYYSPDLTGSRVPTARFNHPIYKKPTQASERAATRVEIDYHGALAGKGYEIFWVEESYFDLYLLHVQGGGRIKIMKDDGTFESKYLSYDSGNGQKFQMIVRYMLDQGYIKSGSIPSQRKYLADHPEKQEEVFGVCPNYIFFKESDEEPLGIDDIPLTEGRSMAVDNGIYKTTGLINFVRTVKAREENGRIGKAPLERFFITQDTGGAIKGNSRCDLYQGYGAEAELIAYNMNELGEQYVLIKK